MPCAAKVRKDESNVNGWEEVCLPPQHMKSMDLHLPLHIRPPSVSRGWKKNTKKHTQTVIPKCLVPQEIGRIRQHCGGWVDLPFPQYIKFMSINFDVPGPHLPWLGRMVRSLGTISEYKAWSSGQTAPDFPKCQTTYSLLCS